MSCNYKICDCKNNWEKSCKSKYNSLELMHERHSIPCAFIQYIDEYMDLLDHSYNDKIFFNHIVKNNLLEGHQFCYYNIACNISDLNIKTRLDSGLEIEGLFTNEIEFLMDYLEYFFGLPYDSNNILQKEFLNRKKEIIKEKYKLKNGKIKVRTGQSIFKKDLLTYYQKCQICGIANVSLLNASHIKPYSQSDDGECIDFYNGLLLCKIHDGLFDSGLISFSDDGNMLISDEICKEDKEILNLENSINLDINDGHKKYLKWHRENIFKR